MSISHLPLSHFTDQADIDTSEGWDDLAKENAMRNKNLFDDVFRDFDQIFTNESDY